MDIIIAFRLLKNGHTVVGVEWAQAAISEFLKKHKLEHVIEEVDIGKVYKVKTIYDSAVFILREIRKMHD